MPYDPLASPRCGAGCGRHTDYPTAVSAGSLDERAAPSLLEEELPSGDSDPAIHVCFVMGRYLASNNAMKFSACFFLNLKGCAQRLDP